MQYGIFDHLDDSGMSLARHLGLSQTLRSHERREPALFSDFICLREPKTEREKPVLLAHRPGAREMKALS